MSNGTFAIHSHYCVGAVWNVWSFMLADMQILGKKSIIFSCFTSKIIIHVSNQKVQQTPFPPTWSVFCVGMN